MNGKASDAPKVSQAPGIPRIQAILERRCEFARGDCMNSHRYSIVKKTAGPIRGRHLGRPSRKCKTPMNAENRSVGHGNLAQRTRLGKREHGLVAILAPSPPDRISELHLSLGEDVYTAYAALFRYVGQLLQID